MELIRKYFKDLSALQMDQFGQLEQLYSEWNDKINVISRKDIEKLYERHVLHSLAITKIIKFRAGSRILDIGTGGGFPGIPLAIMFPDTQFQLIDSIGKKIKVVNAVIDALALKNAQGTHQHSSQLKGKYDFIISRAVTAFPQFLELASGKIKGENKNSLQNGIIYLKGGNLEEELKKHKKKIALYPIKEFFEEEFFETKYVVYYPM